MFAEMKNPLKYSWIKKAKPHWRTPKSLAEIMRTGPVAKEVIEAVKVHPR